MRVLSVKNALFSLYRLFYEIFLCLATWITPKRGKLILFAPFYNDTVNGNLWPLYCYINRDHPEMETVVVAKDRSFYLDLEKQGFPVVLSGSWACFVTTARARYLMVDHNTGTVFWWGSLQALANIKVIQVWHGTGFKQIVLLDEKAKPRGLAAAIRHYDKTVRCKKYDCIISSSDEDKKRKEESFRNKNVFITGYPKNDTLFENNAVGRTDSYNKNGRYEHIILYAPTYRDRGSFQPFRDDFWNQLELEMLNCEGLFLIKKHPQDQALEVPSGFSRIKDISKEAPDLQALLKETELLITDYSNIAVDFVLTGKPVVYYIFDYEIYIKNCRSFYYDLKQTLPGPLVYDQDTLLRYIKNQEWFWGQEYQDRYAEFRDRFHHYQDGGSCRRVVETCLQAYR
ncbi:MAG: CDP-glycerol glycerophosphotransferase family protein [Bacteroidales bacterium]